MPYSNKDGLENIPPTYIYGKNTIFWFRNFIFLFFHNNYPPDNPVVFPSRAVISPLLLAAFLKGECGPPLAFVLSYP